MVRSYRELLINRLRDDIDTYELVDSENIKITDIKYYRDVGAVVINKSDGTGVSLNKSEFYKYIDTLRIIDEI